MTDIVEAMARGIWCATGTRRPCEWDSEAAATKNHWRNIARAAIRACHDAGGLVLREVPGGIYYVPVSIGAPAKATGHLGGCLEGHSAALAAARAAAVEVEP